MLGHGNFSRDKSLFSFVLELVLMMERIFAGKISNSDELTIKYLDDDGDKITLLNDSDLTVALHFHKLLRLFVFVNGQERVDNATNNQQQDGNLIETKDFRNELKDIHNSVQTILDRLQLSSTTTNEVPAVANSTTKNELEPPKQQQQQRSVTPEYNHQATVNHEHPPVPTNVADAPLIPAADTTQPPPTQFQQMPTPHFTPSGYGHEQQPKANLFGPPPSSFPGMPSVPNPIAPRFPPATTPTSSAPAAAFHPTPTPPLPSANSTSGFLGQSASLHPSQQGGFYAQQQATSSAPPSTAGFYAQQQAPPVGNYNPTNAFPTQQPGTSNASPATINPSFPQPTPPPMAFQQPYGTYSQQNSYYNPVQSYPK